MATRYNVDITRNMEPASADPGRAAQAVALKGKAVSDAITIFGDMANDAYQAYQDEKMRQEFEAGKENFFQFEANKEIGQAEELLEAQKQQRRNLVEQGDFGVASQADDVLIGLDSEVQRLKQARDAKRISLGDYLARQQSVARKWIAQYPGRADEIRKKADVYSRVSGIADYAEDYYIRQQFNALEASKKAAAEQEDARQKAAMERSKELVKNGYLPGADPYVVAQQYLKGDTEVTSKMVQMDLDNSVKRQSEAIQLGIETEKKQMTDKGEKLTGLVGVQAATSALGAIAATREKYKPLMDKIERLKAANGGNLPIAATNELRADFVSFRAEAAGKVNAAFDQASIELSKALAGNSSLLTARTEDLNKHRNAILEVVNSQDVGVAASMIENLGKVQAGGMNTYMQLMEATRDLRESYGISGSTLQGYYSNPDSFKKQNPALARIIENVAPTIQGAANAINALVGNAAVQDYLRNSYSTNKTGSVPEGLPKDQKEAVLQSAINANPAGQLAAAKGENFERRDEYVGALSAVMSSLLTESPRGPHFQYVARNFGNVKKSLESMTPEERRLVAANWEAKMARLQGERAPERMLDKEIEVINAEGNFVATKVTNKDGSIGVDLKLKEGLTEQRRQAVARDFNIPQLKLKNAAAYVNTINDVSKLINSVSTQASPAAAPKSNVGPLTQEKQLPAAVQGGVDDLKETLAGLKANLNDAKEGSALHTRLKNDIAEIEKEIKRQGSR